MVNDLMQKVGEIVKNATGKTSGELELRGPKVEGGGQLPLFPEEEQAPCQIILHERPCLLLFNRAVARCMTILCLLLLKGSYFVSPGNSLIWPTRTFSCCR